jgi:hypothetical protein
MLPNAKTLKAVVSQLKSVAKFTLEKSLFSQQNRKFLGYLNQHNT